MGVAGAPASAPRVHLYILQNHGALGEGDCGTGGAEGAAAPSLEPTVLLWICDTPPRLTCFAPHFPARTFLTSHVWILRDISRSSDSGRDVHGRPPWARSVGRSPAGTVRRARDGHCGQALWAATPGPLNSILPRPRLRSPPAPRTAGHAGGGGVTSFMPSASCGRLRPGASSPTPGAPRLRPEPHPSPALPVPVSRGCRQNRPPHRR